MFDDLPCPDCHGREGVAPCPRCAGRNAYVVIGCPAAAVDADARESMRLSSFAERGILPRTGGLDAQRHRDVRLIQLGWSEMNNALAATS